MQAFANGTEHLLAELRRIEFMLHRQVLRLRAAQQITEDQFRGLYIPDVQIDALLSRNPLGQSYSQPDNCETPAISDLTALIASLKAQNEARVQASYAAGLNLPLPKLAHLFGLTSFEVEVLLISLAPELDLKYETLYAYVQNDVAKKRPGVDLALKLCWPSFEERLTHQAVFAPDSPLVRYHLLGVVEDPQDREPPLLARFLKADQRVVDFVLGREQLDARLLAFTRRVNPHKRLGDLALPGELVQQLTYAAAAIKGTAPPIFFFHGAWGAGKQSAAAAVCADLAMPLLRADLNRAMAAETPFAMIMELLLREARLLGACLYLPHLEVLLSPETHSQLYLAAMARAIAGAPIPVILGSEVPWHSLARWVKTPSLSFHFPLPSQPLRLRLWQEALEDDGHRLERELSLDDLANKFILSAGQIRTAASQAGQLTAVRPPGRQDISEQDLHVAARAQSRQGLRHLAKKIDPVYTWSDIVLPPRGLTQLKEVYASVKFRFLVYCQWGFEGKLALGKGTNILFSGPSGTGKTMAAHILARKLNLDIYKIDLSSVVSKYIGDSEKQLEILFKEAQHSNAILFFDEADALFGKRSEVKDAHDRYANIEVAYLLQKMEEYEGIVILATNLRGNMDEAFARRMHHTVEFPFPDDSYRARLWPSMFPADVPLAADVDFGFLARQFELAGGNIRNISLAAAFMAAEDGKIIRMEHLIRATARELQKMGRLPSRADFRNFYDLIRELE